MANWEVLYQKAMEPETDRAMLRERIEVAEKAGEDRFRELWHDHVSSPQEQLAICEARMSLELRRREIELPKDLSEGPVRNRR